MLSSTFSNTAEQGPGLHLRKRHPATLRQIPRNQGGDVVVLLKPDAEAINLRKGEVNIIHTLAYTALGRPFNYGKAVFDEERVSADSALMKEWLNGDQGHFYTLLQKGLVHGNRIKEMPGGLEKIPEGMQYMQDGKVSAEKLAYRISS